MTRPQSTARLLVRRQDRSNDPSSHSPGVLSLPRFQDDSLPGARLVRRVVLITFLCLLVLAAAALLAVATVTVPVTVDGAGVLEPVRVFPVRAQASGVVASVDVAGGDTVDAGQPLLRLDSLGAASALAELEAQAGIQRVEAERLARTAPIDREQANLALAQANARLLRARAELRLRLVEFGLGSDVDSLLAAYLRGTHVVLDGAVADVELARADIAATRTQIARMALARLDAAKQDYEARRLTSQAKMRRVALARGIVRAPARGVVLTDETERLPGTAVREGETVLELADLGSWRATITVRERDVHRVRANDAATLEVPALAAVRDEPLRARVVRIAADVADADPAERGPNGRASFAGAPGTYRVYMVLERAQLDSIGIDAVRRGYSVRAKIVTRRVRAVTLLREWLHNSMRGSGRP